MEIIRDSGNLSKIDTYNLIKSPSIGKMSDIPAEETLQCLKWCQFSDTNDDGKQATILSIMTDSGSFATNSKTFQRDFFDIVAIHEADEIFNFSVYRGQSKAGRDFITCMLRE